METHPKTGLRRVSANPYHRASTEVLEHMAAVSHPATLANPNPLRRLSAAGSVGASGRNSLDGPAHLNR